MRVREATPDELANWDAIVRRFPNHRVPHMRAWIDALGASGCGRPLYLVLENGNGDREGIVGCFPGHEARTFKQLKDSARRNVKRAQRLGLTVRFEDDDAFVDEHYSQVQEVYRRGGYTVPFSKERVLTVFRSLRDAGNLLAVSVYLPGGRVSIATGIFAV